MSETTAVMEKKPSTTRRKQQEAPEEVYDLPEVTATLANFIANLSVITAMTKGEPEVIHEEDSGITIYNY